MSMECEENIILGESQDWTPPDIPLGQYLLARLNELGNRTIQVFPHVNKRLSALALAERAVQYAAALQSLGLQPGDRVVLCSRYHHHFSAIVLATICCGATCAPLNYKFDSGDYSRMLQVIKPKVIFLEAETLPQLKLALNNQRTVPNVIVFDKSEAWQHFLSAASQHSFQEPVIPNYLSTTAAILCSSGTTGLPKGVCISHTNWFAGLHVLRYKDPHIQPDDIIVITSPPYWVTGLLYSFSSMEQGICMVFEFGTSEEQILASVQKHKATLLFTASHFLLSLAKQPSFNSHDLTSLRGVVCGGAAMMADTEQFLETQFSVPIIQVYGMTECIFISGATYKGQRPAGCVGTVVPTLKLKVVDPTNGLSLSCNKPGELLLKGLLISTGYLDNIEATAATFRSDGWTHTGDVGYVDSDGNLFITGRVKDMIKFQGDHVSPVELESILLSHPDVLEAAVIGVPHPTDQEHPQAFVVRKPGASVTAEHLIHLVKNQVAPHKWLRGGVHFLESLPKSATGKISRLQLRNKIIANA